MPSKTAKPKVVRPLTVTQRKALAIGQLLGAVSGADKDAALVAAAELMAEWLCDSAMGERFRERYTELEALNSAKKKPKPAPRPKLVPKSGPDLDHFNPYAKPDPYKLLDWYGHDQFRALVDDFTPQALRDLVDAVQLREPDARPASRSKKQDMVDFVVAHVAGPGY